MCIKSFNLLLTTAYSCINNFPMNILGHTCKYTDRIKSMGI